MASYCGFEIKLWIKSYLNVLVSSSSCKFSQSIVFATPGGKTIHWRINQLEELANLEFLKKTTIPCLEAPIFIKFPLLLNLQFIHVVGEERESCRLPAVVASLSHT